MGVKEARKMTGSRVLATEVSQVICRALSHANLLYCTIMWACGEASHAI